MTVTDWTAVVALAFSAAALALEVRRWFESRPRLLLSVMGDAIRVPGDDGIPRSALSVVNRGTPTVLNLMLVYTFESRWRKWTGKPTMTGVVAQPGVSMPFELGTNKTWTGLMEHDAETQAARAQGQLYLGVSSTHTDKLYFAKVPPKKLELRSV